MGYVDPYYRSSAVPVDKIKASCRNANLNLDERREISIVRVTFTNAPSLRLEASNEFFCSTLTFKSLLVT